MCNQWGKLIWGERVSCDAEATVGSFGRALYVRHDAHPAAVHADLDRKVGGWLGLDPVYVELLFAAISFLAFVDATMRRTIPDSLTMYADMVTLSFSNLGL